MVRIEKKSKVLVLLLVVVGIFSCSEDSEKLLDPIGDVFVTKKIFLGVTKYANSYFVYGSLPMDSAKVIASDGENKSLKKSDSQGFTYGEVVRDSTKFIEDFPTVGEQYAFDAYQGGTVERVYESVVFDDIDFTKFSDSITKTGDLMVEWDENVDAELYMLRLVGAKDSIIFNSGTFASTKTSYLIDQVSGNWAKGHPVNGDTCTLELHAFVFDDEVLEFEYPFNIQEVSISEQVVVWK